MRKTPTLDPRFVVAPVLLALLSIATIGASAARAATESVGTTYVVPESIDATGTRDVTDELNDWLANGTADGAPGARNWIVLNGTYRVEYGVMLGSGGRTRAHPNLVGYTRNHVVLDLTHATLVQKDPKPFSSVNRVLTEPRKRYGVPLLKIVGGQDIEVRGGQLTSTNVLGKYSVQREPWHGVVIVGTDGVQLVGLHVAGVWGDFVYITPRRGTRAHNVAILGGKFERNGRQGVTMNGVDGLEIAGVEFRNVQRELFDHEPTRSGGLTNVDIHDNSGNTGGLGFVNFRPLKRTPMYNIAIRNHRLRGGHFHISVYTSGVQRHDITVASNSTGETRPFRARRPMIVIGDSSAGFDGVTITGNHDVGSARSSAIAVSSASTAVETAPNTFVGFRP